MNGELVPLEYFEEKNACVVSYFIGLSFKAVFGLKFLFPELKVEKFFSKLLKKSI